MSLIKKFLNIWGRSESSKNILEFLQGYFGDLPP